MRAMSSFVLAPVAAAKVFPVCLKSWKCRCPKPTVSRARFHAFVKVRRRRMSVFGPVRSNETGSAPTQVQMRLDLVDDVGRNGDAANACGRLRGTEDARTSGELLQLFDDVDPLPTPLTHIGASLQPPSAGSGCSRPELRGHSSPTTAT